MTLYSSPDGYARSIKEWSECCNIPESRVRSRLRRGVPLVDALKAGRLPQRDRSPSVAYNGEVHTLREWCKIRKLPFTRVYNRYYKGYSVERVLSKGRLSALGAAPARMLEKNGRKATVKEWAKKLGLSENTLYQRIRRRGGDLNHPDVLAPHLSTGNRPNVPRFEAHGQRLTLSEWSRRLGCSRNALRRRLRKGLPLDSVFSPPNMFKRKKLTLDGETLTIADWMERLGLTVYGMRRRLCVYKDVRDILSPRKKPGRPVLHSACSKSKATVQKEVSS